MTGFAHKAAVTLAVREAAARAMQDAGEYLLEESNRTVPIEEGTLGRSGTVTTERGLRIRTAVAYDTPYAVRQHEDLSLQHDEGRRGKWLEQTLREQSQRIAGFIRAGITGALR